MAIRYVFKVGSSPNYRDKEMAFPTLQEARDAAYKERLYGWSTSRIRKVQVADDDDDYDCEADGEGE